jgi:hypothetical protein
MSGQVQRIQANALESGSESTLNPTPKHQQSKEMEEIEALFNYLGLKTEPAEPGDMVEKARQKAKDEQLLPSVPVTFVSPVILTTQLYADRLKWDKRQQEKQMSTRQTFLGVATYFSSTPLRSLKPGMYYVSHLQRDLSDI